MDALVTGGAGFIGSNLVDALLESGGRVTVLDDLSTGRRANLEGALASGARLHEGDVRDAAAVGRAFREARPEVVFHLAAQVDVRRSVAHPAHDADVNVRGTVNVLAAAREAGAARFVHSSTGGAIYGDARRIPTPESEPAAPLSPYGQSKAAAEGYCELFARLYALRVISLRYANVYGPRQDPLGEGGVVAIFCGRAAAGGRPTIFGDGRQTRDFVHVDDVVAANLAAARSGAGGAFNVGRGQETSILELAEHLAPHAAGAFHPDFEPARPGEVRRSALDPGRAEAVLGWRAAVDVDAGVRTLLGRRD